MTDKKENTGGRNTGYLNTGDLNTGDLNTGDLNTGDLNTGDLNTGGRNTGYWNTGGRNTGYRNTGDLNTGDLNTGYWNTCNRETGFFNTERSGNVRVFNKDCARDTWEAATKPRFLYFGITEWITSCDMTNQEKVDNATFHTTGGYLKSYEYKDAFKNSWAAATEEDQALVEQLPNFDVDVFFEISGIDVRKKNTAVTIDGVNGTPDEVTIDGVKYVKAEQTKEE